MARQRADDRRARNQVGAHDQKATIATIFTIDKAEMISPSLAASSIYANNDIHHQGPGTSR